MYMCETCMGVHAPKAPVSFLKSWGMCEFCKAAALCLDVPKELISAIRENKVVPGSVSVKELSDDSLVYLCPGCWVDHDPQKQISGRALDRDPDLACQMCGFSDYDAGLWAVHLKDLEDIKRAVSPLGLEITSLLPRLHPKRPEVPTRVTGGMADEELVPRVRDSLTLSMAAATELIKEPNVSTELKNVGVYVKGRVQSSLELDVDPNRHEVTIDNWLRTASDCAMACHNLLSASAPGANAMEVNLLQLLEDRFIGLGERIIYNRLNNPKRRGQSPVGAVMMVPPPVVATVSPRMITPARVPTEVPQAPSAMKPNPRPPRKPKPVAIVDPDMLAPHHRLPGTWEMIEKLDSDDIFEAALYRFTNKILKGWKRATLMPVARHITTDFDEVLKTRKYTWEVTGPDPVSLLKEFHDRIFDVLKIAPSHRNRLAIKGGPYVEYRAFKNDNGTTEIKYLIGMIGYLETEEEHLRNSTPF